jgi:hypothetical protein
MRRKLQVLLLFSKNIWVFSIAISITVWALTSFAIGKKFLLLFGYIVLIKLLTGLFIFLLDYFLNNDKYLFYQNLGLNKVKLWVFALIIDFLIFPFGVLLFSIFIS